MSNYQSKKRPFTPADFDDIKEINGENDIGNTEIQTPNNNEPAEIHNKLLQNIHPAADKQ